MLDSDRNTILLKPFGVLSSKVPPVLPFICLSFEQLIVVRVDCRGISDDIGRDGDRERCVGGHHLLDYGRDEAPEDRGDHGDTKSESHMTAVCTAFSNCGSFQNPSEDTPLVLSLIKTSHEPNWSKELYHLPPSPPLLIVLMQKNLEMCTRHAI